MSIKLFCCWFYVYSTTTDQTHFDVHIINSQFYIFSTFYKVHYFKSTLEKNIAVIMSNNVKNVSEIPIYLYPPQARMERTDIGTLLIPNIRSSDAGTYLCVGTNTVGSSEAYIEVFVKRGEASHQTNFTLTFFIGYHFNIVLSHWSGEIISSGVTIQPSIASVMEGETIDLNCIVPGTSPASVKWSRAGGLLSSNHQVYLSPLRNIFDLHDLRSICDIRFLGRLLNIWTICVLACVFDSRCWGLSYGSCRPLQMTMENISVGWRVAHPLARLQYLCLWHPAPPVSPLDLWQTGECQCPSKTLTKRYFVGRGCFIMCRLSSYFGFPCIMSKDNLFFKPIHPTANSTFIFCLTFGLFLRCRAW